VSGKASEVFKKKKKEGLRGGGKGARKKTMQKGRGANARGSGSRGKKNRADDISTREGTRKRVSRGVKKTEDDDNGIKE